MKEIKKMQKKSVAKKCTTGKSSDSLKVKQAAKKTQRFSLPVEAETMEVCLAADFNNWNPQPMTKIGNEFQTLIELSPGEYQYKFIVDGQWIPDPSAAAFKENAFGSINSVVIV